MSTPLYKCANCGAVIHRLNLRCGYCNHWNVDPANPQDPPSAGAPGAPGPRPPAAASAPPPAAPTPPAPVAAAPRPAAIAAPLAAPVVEDAPKRRLFGSKPEVAPAPSRPVPLRGGGAPPGGRPLPPTVAAGVSSKSRAVQAVIAQPEASTAWDRGRKSFNGRAAPATDDDAESLARIQAVMAVAYWVATSDDDDEMDSDEYDAIVDTFAELLGEDVDEDALEATIAAWDEAIEADEEAFLAEAVAAIGQGPMRRQALEIATMISAADDDLSDIEEETLGELATALGFGDRESERIIEKALESLEE